MPVVPGDLFSTLVNWIKPGEREINYAQGFSDNRGEEYVFPPLQGINIEEGLKRVNNNYHVYRKLLIKFHDNNINFIEDFKNALKTKNQDLAPLGFTINGSIANSIARIFQALCRLIEGIVDWVIWKLQKSKSR